MPSRDVNVKKQQNAKYYQKLKEARERPASEALKSPPPADPTELERVRTNLAQTLGLKSQLEGKNAELTAQLSALHELKSQMDISSEGLKSSFAEQESKLAKIIEDLHRDLSSTQTRLLSKDQELKALHDEKESTEEELRSQIEDHENHIRDLSQQLDKEKKSKQAYKDELTSLHERSQSVCNFQRSRDNTSYSLIRRREKKTSRVVRLYFFLILFNYLNQLPLCHHTLFQLRYLYRLL